jgi:Cu/Ag efflux protein CusF
MLIRNGGAWLGASALLALTPLGCAKQEPPRQPFTVQRENVVSATATVQKVNLKTREVTLKGEDGRVFTIVAGEEVRNLPQVKVKDAVVVAYHEAVVAEMRPPTDEEKASPRQMVEIAERAPVGGKPGAAAAQGVRLVGTITAIDMSSLRVTMKDLDGGVTTVQAENAENVAKFKVGDPVVFTYTEAVAISVEPAPKAKR